jgi:hypothetical protein
MVEWTSRDINMTERQKGSFVSFLAKMLAVGICGEDLIGLVGDCLNEVLPDISGPPRINDLQIILLWFTYAGDKLTGSSSESIRWTPANRLFLHGKLAKLTLNDNEKVAVAAMDAFLKMYECLWRTDDPMRPAVDMHEDQPAHIQFLGRFCDKFPEVARPGWKQLVRHLRDN